MKKIFIVISVTFLMLSALTGCDKDSTIYSGPDYVMFSDTLYSLQIQNNNEFLDVPVSATQACDYDRTFGVEVVDKLSNAIEGTHYELKSNTIVIKAGEHATSVKVRGLYDNIGITDSLGFALRLISKENMQWSLYGTDTKVVMYKYCPFNIKDFTGYCTIKSSYMSEFMNQLDMRLIETELDPENENTVILKGYFYDGYDVKMKFNPNDINKPFVKMDEQVLASTADAFGTLYGDGKLIINQPNLYESFFSTNETFVVQYMTLHVNGKGTVGTFMNVLKWISDDEGEKLKRQGY